MIWSLLLASIYLAALAAAGAILPGPWWLRIALPAIATPAVAQYVLRSRLGPRLGWANAAAAAIMPLTTGAILLAAMLSVLSYPRAGAATHAALPLALVALVLASRAVRRAATFLSSAIYGSLRLALAPSALATALIALPGHAVLQQAWGGRLGPALVAAAAGALYAAVLLAVLAATIVVARRLPPPPISRDHATLWVELGAGGERFPLEVRLRQRGLRLLAHASVAVEYERRAFDEQQLLNLLDVAGLVVGLIDERSIVTLHVAAEGLTPGGAVDRLLDALAALCEVVKAGPPVVDWGEAAFRREPLAHDIPEHYSEWPRRKPYDPFASVGMGKAVVISRGTGGRVTVSMYHVVDLGRGRLPIELEALDERDPDQAAALLRSLLSKARPTPFTAWSPAMWRRERTRYHDLRVEIPLNDHIGVFGITGSGKSVAIHDIVRYIRRAGAGRVLILDWVGNFTNIPGARVYYPGFDIHIDLYGKFTDFEILSLYEEAVMLVFREGEGFSPAVRHVIAEAIAGDEGLGRARSHAELIQRLSRRLSVEPNPQIRDQLRAALSRLEPIRPEHYTPADGSLDVLDALLRDSIVVVDLSVMPSDTDRVLFAISCLRYLYKVWRAASGGLRLFLVVDEAARLAPEIPWRRGEPALEFVAREGRKEGITLILASQTVAGLKREITANLGTRIVFTLIDEADIGAVEGWFAPWAERIGAYGSGLRAVIADSLHKLEPGECYIISRDARFKEPVPAYFEPASLAGPKQLDRKRLDDVLRTFKWPEMDEAQKRRAIANAIRVITSCGEEAAAKILDRLRRGEEYYRIREAGDVPVIKGGKLTPTGALVLAYFGLKP